MICPRLLFDCVLVRMMLLAPVPVPPSERMPVKPMAFDAAENVRVPPTPPGARFTVPEKVPPSKPVFSPVRN